MISPPETNRPKDTQPLVVRGLSKAYGGVTALHDVSFSMSAGCIAGIVGPNGAGKTTLFDVLTGMTSADGGSAIYKGRRISGCSLEELGRMGIVRTFQDGRVPSDLTVHEYLKLSRPDKYCSPGTRADQFTNWSAETLEDARIHLELIRFAGSRERRCNELSAGEQKFLVALRAVLRHPDLLLLDEPTQNLSAECVSLLSLWLRRLSEHGVSTLLISHDMRFAEGVCDRILRMVGGQLEEVASKSELEPMKADYRTFRQPKSTSAESIPLLSVKELEAGINGFAIARDVSFDVRPGDVVGIVGPNGSGKSTLLRAILGFECRSRGRLFLGDVDGTDVASHDLACRGIGLVLQGGRLADRLTVDDAVSLCWNLGISSRRGVSAGENDPWKDIRNVDDLFARFPQLISRRSTRAGVLSAGEQQLLAIAMAVAQKPRVLLLDEPSTGLHPSVLARLFEWLAELAQAGLGVVIVEQRIPELQSIATTMFELTRGAMREITQGLVPGSVRGEPEIWSPRFSAGEPTLGGTDA